MIKLGCHVGNSGDLMLLGSAQEAVKYQANCFMIYLGAPQNTVRKRVGSQRALEAIKYSLENGIDPNDIIVHAPYIVNLGQSDPDKFDFACRFLSQEVEQSSKCGLNKIVLHPGAHVGNGSLYGINRIAQGINIIIQNTKYSKTKILLETMSGKGTECGRNFEEIAAIIDQIDNKDRIAVCLDTCHINDAGYDLVNNYENVINEFDKIIGLKYLKVIHINDSKNPLNAKKDRHENIGFGHIGFDTIIKICNDERFKDIPKILETPYIPSKKYSDESYPPYKEEIEMIVNGQKDQLRNLKTLVSTRKARLEEHNNKPTYNRIVFYGTKELLIHSQKQADSILKGIPSGAGVVRGKIKFVKDPASANLNNEIMLA